MRGWVIDLANFRRPVLRGGGQTSGRFSGVHVDRAVPNLGGHRPTAIVGSIDKVF